MPIGVISLLFMLTVAGGTFAQTSEHNNVLQVTEDFFVALEKQDTAAFRKMFLPDAYNYAVWERGDSVMVRSQSPVSFRLNPKQIIKERLC